LKVWNTKPIFSLRYCASALELRPESSRPSILSEPEVGVSSAPIRFMKVDLPEPE